MGVVRSLQFVGTLVVAGPVAMVGVFNLLEGQYGLGAFFLVAALGLLAVSEYVYVRLTDKTVGRVRRLKNYRPWRRRGGSDDGDGET
ncbi:hypothetical protein HWV07_13065 [Natronomonas salina]|uniref:DUF7533 family protein n=1 Tax=Natronomonas salina TaxID=1710540 RepID=UPI0015B4FB7D|nr:hypothetical protein [Natronomonas salina]QLD89907.1 hypothetical protein HWV07_13065 [Natronomonas salina]